MYFNETFTNPVWITCKSYKASYDEYIYANRITVYHNKDNCLKSIAQKILEMSKQSNFEEFLSNFERKKKDLKLKCITVRKHELGLNL